MRVIPILMEGAVVPTRQDLPESLARRNALPIRHEAFRSDAGRLIAAIERVLATVLRIVDRSRCHQTPRTRAARDDRAARLLTEAERIARSLTIKNVKASALNNRRHWH